MASIKIAEISRTDLESHLARVSITDVEHLSSYNWVEASVPTIAIPGSPALWTPPQAAQRQVKKDSGLIYIAQNAARHPESPLEPLFRALYIAHPAFDIRSVDLVTDRNNMRKLLSFVNPSLDKKGLEPFTIEVEVMNDTAIFCRAETKTFEVIGPRQYKGFGHEFEKAYTTVQLKGSTGHHRIISYRLGGMKLLVRYETDGYIARPSKASTPSTDSRKPLQDSDNLSSMLESLSLSPPKPCYVGSDKSTLRILEKGQVVPIESTLEIKTRTSKRPIKIDEVLPQLWVSQTPNLVRAYHRNGLFERPEVEDVSGELKKWEEDHHADLGKLVVLIKNLISVVKESGVKAVIRYDDRCDKLVVWKKREGGRKLLPDDLYSRFIVRR
ncbi:hypothetical protein IFM58399_05003 [Aspergillus lentulus]|uniref:uncharacterized protein n=1 Tax=Aspergillus lentulus TaxID=293939 RepID=UPI001392F4B7|nr:uncharacterized protein IFM58399_05003 [Aspergillus lentulus]GFF37760.1 hypothetical protein IFM58399_05003 [Aspergillus lentulus]